MSSVVHDGFYVNGHKWTFQICLINVGQLCTNQQSQAPFTLTFQGRNLAAIFHLVICVKVTEANQPLCVMVSWRSRTGLCPSDGVHSLTNKPILRSSNKRRMSHASNHKATLQGQTTVMWKQVAPMGTCLRKGKQSYIWKSVCHPVCPTHSPSHFHLKKTASVPSSESQVAPVVLCNFILSKKLCLTMSSAPSSMVLFLSTYLCLWQLI